MRNSMLIFGTVGALCFASLGFTVNENEQAIVNNKASILSIGSCTTYNAGCNRLAKLNNKGSLVKKKAFKIYDGVFAVSVDNHMVKILYNKKENNLEYVGIEKPIGIKEVDRGGYTIYKSFVPDHLKEDEGNTSSVNKPGDVIIIDSYEKTEQQWKELEDKFNSDEYSKGIPSEDIKEHEALMKYKEQVANDSGNYVEFEEVSKESESDEEVVVE